MRRPRFRKPETTVSLFPFLAVLICTMGALILMLVLVVKQADAHAQENQQQDAAELDQIKQQLALEKEREDLRQEMLQQIRPNVTRRLAEVRKERSHFQEQIQLLKEQARQLQAELDELERLKDSRDLDRDTTASEVARVTSAIEQARQQLAEAEQRAASQPRSFAIIPYKGPNGTSRRPIYIECTGTGITFQPEGVTIGPEDFEGPLVPGNPLDAALLATREYLNRYSDIAKSGEPYPLLIVRPDGTGAYNAARMAMRSWDDEFGYELIDEDIKLKYQPADPRLANLLKQTIEDARRRQAILAAAQPARFNQGSAARGTGGLRASPNGGFVAEGGYVGQGRGASSDRDGSGRGSQGRDSSDRGSQERRSQGGGSFETAADAQRARRPGNEGSQQAQSGDNNSPNNPAARQNPGQPPGGSNGQPGGNSSASSGGTCVADSRGQGWALPSKTPGATAIRRPIRVVCHADRFGIVPGAATDQQYQEIPFARSTFETADDIVSAIWSHMDGWGIAGRNAYWKPELKVVVAPGGERRFNELYEVFRDSGFDMEAAAP